MVPIWIRIPTITHDDGDGDDDGNVCRMKHGSLEFKMIPKFSCVHIIYILSYTGPMHTLHYINFI